MRKPSTPRPRHLVLDIGRVLVFFNASRACEGFAAHSTLNAVEIEKTFFSLPWLNELETGRITGGEFFESLRDPLKLHLEYPLFKTIFSEIFELNWPMLGFLAARENDFSYWIISNTNAIHQEWLERNLFPRLPAIQGFTLSHQVGSAKPDPAIYHAFFSASGWRGEHCLFLDDLQVNVEAALRCGLPAHQYLSHAEFLRAFAPWAAI